MATAKSKGRSFAEFRAKHGFTEPIAQVEGDVSLDVISRRLSGLEAELGVKREASNGESNS